MKIDEETWADTVYTHFIYMEMWPWKMEHEIKHGLKKKSNLLMTLHFL